MLGVMQAWPALGRAVLLASVALSGAAMATNAAAFDEQKYLAHTQRAQASERAGNFGSAGEAYEALAGIDPQGAAVHWSRACLNRAAAGQIPRAKTDCEAALRLSPTSPHAHDARGLIFLKTGVYRQAAEDFDAALQVYPSVPFSFYGRGLAKLHLGDTAAGNADIAKANSLQPDIANRFARFGVKADPSLIAGPSACGAGPPAQDLSAIPACTVVYCAAATEVQDRKNLKHIDDMVVELQLRTVNYRSAIDRFRRACRGIGGDLKRAGKDMEAFRLATFELGVTRGRLHSLYDSLQRPPEDGVFADAAATMARTYRQTACMSQIAEAPAKALNAAIALLDQSPETFECSSAAINRWK